MTRAAVADPLALVAEVERQAPLVDSWLHGPRHWRCVALTALRLCDVVPSGDPDIAFLFGLLHDARRRDDGYDPDHGPRAARLVRRLHARGGFVLAPATLGRLTTACRIHTHAPSVPDPVVGVCLDADRLSLTRLGKTVRTNRLSTTAAKHESFMAWAAELAEDPPAWDVVVEAYAGHQRRVTGLRADPSRGIHAE